MGPGSYEEGKMTAIIKKIQIKTDDKMIELTLDEAKQIKDVLCELFKEEQIIVQKFVPYYPYYPYVPYPNWPNDTIITCQE